MHILKTILKIIWRILTFWAFAVALYFLLGYLILPPLLKHYHHNPALTDIPKTTFTALGAPFDPINVSLIGNVTEVTSALRKAGWNEADRINPVSDLLITGSVAFHLPYKKAPVSNEYIDGRIQDLAFEKIVGGSAKQRHHLRLWQTALLNKDRRPIWIGSVTFDVGIQLTAKFVPVTHRISPDIDSERDGLMNDLIKAHQLSELYQISGIGPTISGRNADGDWYYTDGEIDVGVISLDNILVKGPPLILPNPPIVEAKNTFWQGLKNFIKIFKPSEIKMYEKVKKSEKQPNVKLNESEEEKPPIS